MTELPALYRHKIGSPEDRLQEQEHLAAVERGLELQFRPEGRGHMRWVVRAMVDWSKLRRERRRA